MNRDDLIERLEKEIVLMLEGSRCCLKVNDIREIIAALSPVLPEDVQVLCKDLRDWAGPVLGATYTGEDILHNAADLIKRLQRENEAFLKALKNESRNCSKHQSASVELGEEVKRLEAMLDRLASTDFMTTTHEDIGREWIVEFHKRCKYAASHREEKETINPEDWIGEKIKESCPECGSNLMRAKKGADWCSNPDCNYGLNKDLQ